MSKLVIGFIGLGNMGGPMVVNIARAEHDLIVYDSNEESYSKLEGLEFSPATSPMKVGEKSDIVFTSLPSVMASEEVWLGRNGVLEGAKDNAIFVELSTVNPELVKKIGRKASEKKIMVLDAGVSGGVKKAVDGTLTIMAGGQKKAFERARPVFEVIGEKIYHVGELGTGMVTKLVNNAIAHINVVAFLECVSVGLEAGIDINTLYEVISKGSGTSRQFETRFKNKVMERDFYPGMKLELVYKDSMLMLEMAANLGMPAFLTSVAHQIFEMGRAKGLEEMDYASLIQLWENMIEKPRK